MLNQNPINQIENVHQFLLKNMILWLRYRYTLSISKHFWIAGKQKDCFGCWKDVTNLKFTVNR